MSIQRAALMHTTPLAMHELHAIGKLNARARWHLIASLSPSKPIQDMAKIGMECTLMMKPKLGLRQSSLRFL